MDGWVDRWVGEGECRGIKMYCCAMLSSAFHSWPIARKQSTLVDLTDILSWMMLTTQIKAEWNKCFWPRCSNSTQWEGQHNYAKWLLSPAVQDLYPYYPYSWWTDDVSVSIWIRIKNMVGRERIGTLSSGWNFSHTVKRNGLSVFISIYFNPYRALTTPWRDKLL